MRTVPQPTPSDGAAQAWLAEFVAQARPAISAPAQAPPTAIANGAKSLQTAAVAATSGVPATPVPRSSAEPSTPTSSRLVGAEAATGGCVQSLGDDLGGDFVGVGATYEFNPCVGDQDPYGLTVRFIGRRTGTATSRDPRDRFERVEQVEGMFAGSGRVTLTTKVVGVNAGQWQVRALAVLHDQPARKGDAQAAPPRARKLPTTESTTHTRIAPLVHGPGVRQAAWPALVLAGVVVALVAQALLLNRSGGDWRTGLWVSGVAVLAGYLGAKIYYMVQHRLGPRRFAGAGTCIQGFLLACFGTAAVLLTLTGTPVGAYLDATTPGLLLAMAIGRPGCLLGGCCVGRPTPSRWGLWSSDRRVGVRRIPVQLLEAAMALALGAAALGLVLTVVLPVPGALFVGGMALYTLGRQLLFPLRREPRRSSTGRVGTLVAAAAVAVAAVLLSVLSA